jgi:hypothetical protein
MYHVYHALPALIKIIRSMLRVASFWPLHKSRWAAWRQPACPRHEDQVQYHGDFRTVEKADGGGRQTHRITDAAGVMKHPNPRAARGHFPVMA